MESCSRCGFKWNEEDHNFCRVCGKPVSKKAKEQAFLIGDKVQIVEGRDAGSDIYECLTDEYQVGEQLLVKLKCHETGKYYAGGYSVDFLQKVFH